MNVKKNPASTPPARFEEVMPLSWGDDHLKTACRVVEAANVAWEGLDELHDWELRFSLLLVFLRSNVWRSQLSTATRIFDNSMELNEKDERHTSAWIRASLSLRCALETGVEAFSKTNAQIMDGSNEYSMCLYAFQRMLTELDDDFKSFGGATLYLSDTDFAPFAKFIRLRTESIMSMLFNDQAWWCRRVWLENQLPDKELDQMLRQAGRKQIG